MNNMRIKFKYIRLYLCLIVFSVLGLSCGTSKETPENPNGQNTFTPGKGIDLYGRITDDKGIGITDVVVSDGYKCVLTDKNGWYSMKKNKNALFVNYSIPSGYKANPRSFYQTIDKRKKQYDFKTTKLADNESHFNLLVMADPQVKSVKDVARFRTETMPDIKKSVDESKLPIYGLCLGDIVDEGKQELTYSMEVLLQSTSMPFFVAIGNHDKETGKTGKDITKTYCKHFGPLNYSFNRGDVHFICLDNIIYKSTEDYTGGITDEQLAWMKDDLKYVDNEKLVVVYYHIPWRQSDNEPNRNEMMGLLKSYKNVLLLAGHAHYQENFHGSKPYKFAERIHGAACGAWWHSNICAEGTPNGYQMYEIDGNKVINNYYKSTNYDKNFQIRLHHGNGSWGGSHGMYGYGLGADYIIANIWNYDKGWKVQVYEDDVYSGDMLLAFPAYFKPDAWSQAYHIGVVGRNPKNYSQKSTHDFVYKPKNPGANIKVVAIDKYGNRYEQTEFVTDLESAHIYK